MLTRDYNYLDDL